VVDLYLDEQISERLAEALEALGYDVVSVTRLGNKGLSDALHFMLAARAGRVVVTYDVEDFTLLHEAWQAWPHEWNVTPLPRHAGVLLIKPYTGLDAVTLAGLIHRLASAYPSIDNRLFAWNQRTDWQEIV
jgi:hypothetical protein